MDPLVGQTVGGRYKLRRLIGKGAMGRVYLATDDRLHGRECAVKVLQVHADEDERARFEREVRIVSLMRSPNVVQVLDSGVMGDGRPYIVMELLVGNSLHHVVKRRGALPPVEAIGIAIDVLQGLAEAHVYGVVHRDLKPANVFLCPTADDGVQAKVLDFGVAKQLRGDDADITKTKASVGTPRYMSPEQFVQGALSARTDLYGAGVLLHILLTGEPPFSGNEPVPKEIEALPRSTRLAWLHLHQPPPPVEGVSDELRGLVRQMMAKQPVERPPSARAVIDLLRAVPEAADGLRTTAYSGAPGHMAPISDDSGSQRHAQVTTALDPPSRVGDRRWFWVAVPILVALAAGVGVYFARSPSAGPGEAADEPSAVRVQVGQPAAAPAMATPDAEVVDAAPSIADAGLADAQAVDSASAAPPRAAARRGRTHRSTRPARPPSAPAEKARPPAKRPKEPTGGDPKRPAIEGSRELPF